MSEPLTYYRIALDDETTALLIEMSEACHCPPAILLAVIARDVLVDDAEVHGQVHAGVDRALLN